MRISNSFSEGEIQVLDFILTTLLRGGTPSMAVRSKDFASLCRKVQAMKSKAGDLREGRVTPKRAPDKSSVGLIGAPDHDTSVEDEALSDVG
ncbi:MAG: hypothetical protein OHK0013_37600 [Sandaracinaceae bacterium]